ncbi:MAG TPA: response regulator [Flavitalea sp.]|nr:response regulator [Flavitalea sp.]
MHYVLAVSDDEEDIAFLDQAFRTQPGNIPVTCMNKGLKLWDFICNLSAHEFPFLIIIDHYLSDIDSLALLTRLKADHQCSLVPVAMMSGFASEQMIHEYYRAGANCFYKKPLDISDWTHMADCLLTLFHNRS